jgi:hypothetical protein
MPVACSLLDHLHAVAVELGFVQASPAGTVLALVRVSGRDEREHGLHVEPGDGARHHPSRLAVPSE